LCHAKVTKTRTVYAHLFEDDDADAMAALGAMRQRAVGMGNVIRLRGWDEEHRIIGQLIDSHQLVGQLQQLRRQHCLEKRHLIPYSTNTSALPALRHPQSFSGRSS
jgi:hypothetical protein